jgi:UDP-N-acetylglucosamine transferase subunit ALG13
MILVAVGSSQFPFDRLLRAVDDVLRRDEPLVVQHGPSELRPRGATCVPFLPMDDLARLIREARVVVTHAGVGSILLSLANGKRPCVVPRRRSFRETVDDHQLESARRFARAGLVTLVEEPRGLADVITQASAIYEPALEGESRLVGDLRTYLASILGPRPLEER